LNGLPGQVEVTLWFFEKVQLRAAVARFLGLASAKLVSRDFLLLCFKDSILQMLSTNALPSYPTPVQEIGMML
jgi:hypothetical protein